jgi:hypothetical protein
MTKKILLILFSLGFWTSNAQIDTIVYIRNYFSIKQAKKRHTYLYPKTDSMIRPLLMGRVTFSEAGPNKKYPKKTFLINNEKVSDSVYQREWKNVEARLNKNEPYYVIAYHKNGQLYCKCKYIGERNIDTCIKYSDAGEMRSRTYANVELTKNYVPNAGKPLYITHYLRREEFDKNGVLKLVSVDDIDNNVSFDEIYKKGKFVRKVKR